MIAAAKHPLLLFAGKGELPVGKVIADSFSSCHAEGDEAVALPATPYGERPV